MQFLWPIHDFEICSFIMLLLVGILFYSIFLINLVFISNIFKLLVFFDAYKQNGYLYTKGCTQYSTADQSWLKVGTQHLHNVTATYKQLWCVNMWTLLQNVNVSLTYCAILIKHYCSEWKEKVNVYLCASLSVS